MRQLYAVEPFIEHDGILFNVIGWYDDYLIVRSTLDSAEVKVLSITEHFPDLIDPARNA